MRNMKLCIAIYAARDMILGVGHLLLPDAMPARNVAHLLPRRISNRARCHLLPAAGFFIRVWAIWAYPRLARSNEPNVPSFHALLTRSAFDEDLLTLCKYIYSGASERRGADEDILFAAIRRDEAEAFSALYHLTVPSISGFAVAVAGADRPI